MCITSYCSYHHLLTCQRKKERKYNGSLSSALLSELILYHSYHREHQQSVSRDGRVIVISKESEAPKISATCVLTYITVASHELLYTARRGARKKRPKAYYRKGREEWYKKNRSLRRLISRMEAN
jgi:hypothetical protein